MSPLAAAGRRLLEGASPAVRMALGAAGLAAMGRTVAAAREAAEKAAYDALVADHVPEPPDRLSTRMDVLSWDATTVLARRSPR